MGAAVRAWMSAAAALVSVAAARAQTDDSHTHLIPLPHPEILHPNDPNLPPSVLHPHVYQAPPHLLAHHQHLVPLPHPELMHPRPEASFGSIGSFGSGLVMTAKVPTDANQAPAAAADHAALVDNPREVPGRLVACWHPPPLGDDSTHEVTVRMEFARAGSIIGAPLVTYVAAGTGADARKALVDSIQSALRQCTPLNFAPSFGADMAGYPFAIRFIEAHGDTNPQH